MLKLGQKLGQKLGKKNSSNRKKIMVRCERFFRVVYKEEADKDLFYKGAVYNCYDYYLVDLKGDRDQSVLEPYCEPLLDDAGGVGNLICLGSSMYSIPFITYGDYDSIPASLPYPGNGDMINHLSEMFVTTFDKTQNPKKWVPSGSGPVPVNFHCAALSGTIYGLESGNTNNALCFHPSENCWIPSGAPPPSDLYPCSVTGKLIPDPTKDRILVHLAGGALTQPCLFAWHPKIKDETGGAWELIRTFREALWYDGTALINIGNKSLLFFFFNHLIDLLKVWSVEDKEFLEISWCNEIPDLEFTAVHAHSMCYLGKNQLCLALCFPPIPDNELPVTFLILDVKLLSKSDIKRKGKEPAVKSKGKEPATDASSDSMITFTYVSSKSFKALDTRFVVDISPLGDVY